DTKRILSALNQQVDLYVLASESSRDEQLAATLQKYEELSSNIQVTYVDPAVSPNFYQKYTQDQISQNSLIAVCGERSKVIDYSNIYETEVDYQTYSSKTTGYDAEGQLTSAIQYVTNEDMPTVYTVTGHGEISVSTRFKELIEKMNLGLKELNLLETDAVPQDCKALMILGPSTDFSKDDADKVRNYLADGGKALITTQYTTDAMQNFKSILEAYGLQLNNGMVIEQNQERYYQNPMYLLPEISYDTLTEKVANEYIFAPYAQGLTIQEQEQDVRSYTELLTTSEQAFLKSDVQNMTNFDKEEGDLQGPFTIGVSVIDSQSEAQLLVYTSAMLFSDSADQQVSGNNSTLFASSIRSLAAQSESSSLIVIPVKPYTQESLVLSQGTILTAGFFSVLAIPVLLIAVGVLIWMRRRKA
ncbi:MAG: GldG family protein, partial [Eubacterium sp.]|nr:GldG family protein [Eubacterium sp.]